MTDDRPGPVPPARSPHPNPRLEARDGGADDDSLWAYLRSLTAARIGPKRPGPSLATGPLLDFKLAPARARDGVREPLDEARLTADIAAFGLPVLAVASAAEDRQRYLMRPDLGRRLAPGAQATLAPHGICFDIEFVMPECLTA